MSDEESILEDKGLVELLSRDGTVLGRAEKVRYLVTRRGAVHFPDGLLVVFDKFGEFSTIRIDHGVLAFVADRPWQVREVHPGYVYRVEATDGTGGKAGAENP